MWRAMGVVVLWVGMEAGGGARAFAADSVPAEPVYTRARVVSVDRDGGSGGKLYVRLRLLPRAKLPFTTQTFRVVDQALLAGVSEGAWVRFTARRLEGENTLTAIQIAEECKLFQPCQ
jgi:Cu/Ag efflux protein CusF